MEPIIHAWKRGQNAWVVPHDTSQQKISVMDSTAADGPKKERHRAARGSEGRYDKTGHRMPPTLLSSFSCWGCILWSCRQAASCWVTYNGRPTWKDNRRPLWLNYTSRYDRLTPTHKITKQPCHKNSQRTAFAWRWSWRCVTAGKKEEKEICSFITV